jgi:hypothetical protein
MQVVDALREVMQDPLVVENARLRAELERYKAFYNIWLETEGQDSRNLRCADDLFLVAVAAMKAAERD